MSFTSISFILFVLLAVILYYIVPNKVKYLLLLVFSYIFYFSFGLGVLKYILYTTISTYICGCYIGSIRDKYTNVKEKCKRKTRLITAICLILNFGLLYFIKYWNFTLNIVGIQGFRVNLLLPLGISFYIFQSMGYIIDLSRGKYPPQKNFFKLALFISFFPQMVQGPISRYNELGNQLYAENSFSLENIKEGLKVTFWGYFKKMLIADRLAVITSVVIGNYNNYDGIIILFGVIAYSIQLYCDFSGGIDIARGIAYLFGIKMPQNFKRPIFATSLADFWRRWHITLGTWFKDYVFYPISFSKPFIKLGIFIRKFIKGKSGKILTTSLATFIVYLIIGLWHGANLKYIVYGLWNGSILTISLLLSPLFISLKNKLAINDKSKLYKLFCIIRTSIIVIIGRYIVCASSILDSKNMIFKTFKTFNLSDINLNFSLTLTDYIVILIGLLIIFVVEFNEEKGVRITEKIENKGMLATFFMNFLIICFFIVFGIFRGGYISSEFIYRQF